jgi:hypothetical protein
MQGIGVLLKNGSQRPPMATFSHKGRREVKRRCENYAASMRLNPFHIAVAAPEVSTGKIRVS